MLLAAIIVAAAGRSAGAVALDVVATLITFVALVRIVITPRDRWAHGRLSKTAWILATLWLIPYVGSLVLPLGGLAAIWKTRRLSRKGAPDPLDVPLAEGSPLLVDKERQ